MPTKGTSTQRGYDWRHRRRRAALLPYAYGQPCPYYGRLPICTGPMLRGQALDLDHQTGNRIAHASCNRSYGDGTRGKTSPPTLEPVTSRDW